MPPIISSSDIAPSFRAFVFACLVGLAATAGRPAIVRAQAQSVQDARTEAVRLRNAGDFRGAVAVLRPHLERYPNDGDALRLLAETLYWLKDFAGARAVSERALVAHPEDTDLRLQYARMLIETGFAARAHEVLAPVGSPSTRGRADAILGTLAYWEGDLTNANHLLESAIASGDTDPAIRRMHTDIAVLTAPWVGVSPAYQHDDQPINRTSLGAEAGWFPVPSTSFALHAQGLRFQLGDTATRNASEADLTLSHYAAAAHTEIEIAAGAVTRSFGASSDFTGSAALAIRLPTDIKLGIRAYRAPYFATEASLSQAVMTSTGIAYAHLDDPRGWLGEAAYQLQRYPDSNNLTGAYVWLLAPLVHSSDLTLRAGYSGSLQTSSESRFSLVRPRQAYLPGDPRFDLTGAYQPYYTPIDLQSHSAIGAITAHLSRVTTFNANGSYAFRATETAPTLLVLTTNAPNMVQRFTYTRNFNPWKAHASLEIQPSTDLSFVASGDIFRTGFYTASSASVALVYRLAGRAIRMAGGY